MSGGSQQLRLFRRAIRDGYAIEDAENHADIPVAEARLHYADDLRQPPPADAYRLLGIADTLAELCSPWGRA